MIELSSNRDFLSYFISSHPKYSLSVSGELSSPSDDSAQVCVNQKGECSQNILFTATNWRQACTQSSINIVPFYDFYNKASISNFSNKNTNIVTLNPTLPPFQLCLHEHYYQFVGDGLFLKSSGQKQIEQIIKEVLLYNSSIEMARFLFLGSLRHVIDILSTQPKPASPSVPYSNEITRSKTHFFENFQRNIYSAKTTIKSKLQSFIAQGLDHPIDSDEVKLYACLKNKLTLLNCEASDLLKDELFALYMDFNELRLKAMGGNFSGVTLEILKVCIQALGKLLKKYFVYNEHEIRRKTYQKQCQLHQLFSEKNINQQSKLEKDKCYSLKKIEDFLMRQAEELIDSKPLAELFQLQMKKQERRLGQSFQVCRICSSQIKLKDLERHVYVCAKRCELRLRLDSKNEEIAEIQQSIKSKFIQSCEEYVKEPIDQEFRNICNLILHFPKKHERCTFKRSSLIGLRGDKNIITKIEGFILSFVEVYGENNFLTQWLTVYKERAFIQKAINTLEVSSFFSENHQKSDESDPRPQRNVFDRRSARKKLTAFSNKIIQKRSIEPDSNKSLRIQSPKHSSTSSRGSSSEHSKKDKALDKLITSRKSLSKKLGKESQEEIELNVDSIHHYSSMPALCQREQTFESQSHIQLSSFEILKFLGQGAFGKVYMARRKKTKDVYALKIIKLPQDSQQKELASIRNQYQIFKTIGGEHLVKAPFSFHQVQSQIFIMQYMPGGDLRKLLTDEVYFQEDLAKFYLAEIILAVELLHSSGIIHRDLKPENLVIDRKGHLKLTDFGLSEFQVSQKLQKSKKSEADALNEAKQVKNRKRRTAFTGADKQKIKLIGSPDYIAPEIINQTSFSNYTIDWWSLGVMAYELIVGTRPFCGDSIHEIVDNITNFNIEWPEVGQEEGMISPQAKDLITQLLNKNFMERLGANGADELKNHPFFNGIEWQNIKTTDATFLPTKMTTLYEMASMQESVSLRKQIEQFIKGSKRTTKKVKLETFVRYDLLKSETIANMEKKQEMSSKKLKKLRTLKQIASQFQQNLQKTNNELVSDVLCCNK